MNKQVLNLKNTIGSLDQFKLLIKSFTLEEQPFLSLKGRCALYISQHSKDFSKKISLLPQDLQDYVQEIESLDHFKIGQNCLGNNSQLGES